MDDVLPLVETLVRNRVLVIAHSCHREAMALSEQIRKHPLVPEMECVSACSSDLFPLLTRTQSPAIIEIFHQRQRPRLSLCMTDLDVLSTAQSKTLCLELKKPRSPSDGCLLVVWPGIPKKSLGLLPQEIVVTSDHVDDTSASRLAARSILVDRPPPAMRDHSELVPACERSLVGLLVHANMYHLTGPGITDQYVAALECTLAADPADRLSQTTNFTPTVELASMVRTIGVSHVLATPSRGRLPRGELAFTKLLAAHATTRTRLKTIREQCTANHLTMRELAIAVDKESVDADSTSSAKRIRAILT